MRNLFEIIGLWIGGALFLAVIAWLMVVYTDCLIEIVGPGWALGITFVVAVTLITYELKRGIAPNTQDNAEDE